MTTESQTTDDWWMDAKNAEEIVERARIIKARRLADRIFMLDAQYQDGVIEAKSRDDFIDHHIVPLLMGRSA